MSARRRALTAAAAGAVLAGTALLGAAGPAEAYGQGCPYPYVCFYPTYNDFANDHPVSRYQDVTSSWQYLRSQSVGADWIVNTRHDDVAYLHFTNGYTTCLAPDSIMNENYRQVDRIRIDSESTCPIQ